MDHYISVRRWTAGVDHYISVKGWTAGVDHYISVVGRQQVWIITFLLGVDSRCESLHFCWG